jgi:hypothetical protein
VQSGTESSGGIIRLYILTRAQSEATRHFAFFCRKTRHLYRFSVVLDEVDRTFEQTGDEI